MPKEVTIEKILESDEVKEFVRDLTSVDYIVRSKSEVKERLFNLLRQSIERCLDDIDLNILTKESVEDYTGEPLEIEDFKFIEGYNTAINVLKKEINKIKG